MARDLAALRDPQRAVGKTVARIVTEQAWTLQIVFTDDTKLMITPNEPYEATGVEASFHDDLQDD